MKIETFILAGGKSSRMGTDKALLKVNHQPLIVRLYYLAQKISTRVSVITSTGEKYQPLLPPECNFIQESAPFQGPLKAFAEALKYAQSEFIFLLACDLPLLTVEEVRNWLNQIININNYQKNFYSKKDSYIAFLPENEKGWDCLCGFYKLTCLDSLNNYLKENNASFQGWLNQENVYPLIVNNKQVLFNCNTPSDYQLLLDNLID